MTTPTYRVDVRGEFHSFYSSRAEADRVVRDLIANGVAAIVVEEREPPPVYGDAYRRMAKHFPGGEP